MNFKPILIAAALALSGSAFANTCSSTQSLGSLGAYDSASFANGLVSAGEFNDCYTFSLAAPVSVSGNTYEWDFGSWFGDLTLNSVQLFSVGVGGALASLGTDPTPHGLAFGTLGQGDYQLVVSGELTAGKYATFAAYTGEIRTGAVAAVPEPSTYALLGAGLVAVAMFRRRRNRD